MNAVAENGGVVYADRELELAPAGETAREFEQDYIRRHGSLGWGEHDLVNRWRETEICVAPEHPREQVEEVADDHGLDVVYTGYAYHVKSQEVDKGGGIETAAENLGLDLDDFVAIGDSENDVEIFQRVGTSYAVANADDPAKQAADAVVDANCYRGFLEALDLASDL